MDNIVGYCNEDGSPDTWEQITLSNRCFAVALGFLLQENEGIVVELPFQEKYPKDQYGKYKVFKHNGCIRGSKIEDDHETIEGDQLNNGDMFWIVDEEKENIC